MTDQPNSSDSRNLEPCERPPEGEKGKKKGEKKEEGRRESSAPEKALYYTAWAFLLGSIVYSQFLSPRSSGQTLSFWIAGPLAGSKDLLDFISTHLISAMVPAFFLAAAISTFFSKETLIKTMGQKTSPWLSYPLAAFAGGVLTVCSCGILPIFMSLYQGGAGLGPAFTFLYSSPAINLISLVYTWKILPWSMLWARIIGVAVCSIAIGIIMKKFLSEPSDPKEEESTEKKKPSTRTAPQDWAFFGMLVVFMLTSTEALSFLTSAIVPSSWFSGMDAEKALLWARFTGKMFFLGGELLIILALLRSWFTWDETRKWVKRTGRQMRDIIPMVFLGIFYSGMLGGVQNMTEYLGYMRENSVLGNLLASFIGSMLYFGSIVGVNVVDIFHRWGMNDGPALALLLAGPTISLPSILAMLPIVGYKKTFWYLALVVVFSALCGLTYGALFAHP